jgi:diguanylate cyclase (GGDEF)-like protein/PAS domain S-box-containing protein
VLKLTTEPRRIAIMLGLVASVVLALVALRALGRAGDLQEEYNRSYALQIAASELTPLLGSGDAEGLRGKVESLVRRAGLGISFLSVRDPADSILAVDGRYENLSVPLLSGSTKQTLREWLYRWSSNYGRMDLRASGNVIGRVEYAFAPALSRDVREQAVRELRIAGWSGLLLALPSALALGLVLLRASQFQPELVQRVAGTAPQTGERIDEDVEIPETLRRNAGSAFDELGRAILTVDRDARIRYINQSAAELTGWTVEEARGRLVYSVFHPLDDQHAPLVTPAETCIRESREYLPAEMLLRSRSGTVRHIEVMAVLLRDDPDGGTTGSAMMFHDIGARREHIDELRRSARLSQGVIDHLVEGVLTTDPAGVIRFANARALRMFGYASDELVGATATRLMPVPFLNTPGLYLTDYVGSRPGARLPRVIGWRKDATTFPIELLVQPMSVDGSEGLVIITRDISERMRSENLSQRLGRLLDAAAEEIYIFDAQSLYFAEVNRGAQRNLGFQASELMRMTPLSISAELEPEAFQGFLARLRGGEIEHVVYRCKHVRADGTQYPVEVRLNFSREEEPPIFMAMAVDISEQEAAEAELRHQAQHDPLTGLPNRATLIDRLRQATLSASRTSRQVGVYFIDLDRFKLVNDSHGHEVGDLVLSLAGKRLSNVLREADTVARLGGDEFVVVAQGLRGTDDAEALARKIMDAFQPRMEVPGHELRVSASVGVAIYPLDESDPESLIRHADAAMYQAKQSGRNQFRVYNVEVPPERRRRMELERGVHVAVALQQLVAKLTPVFHAGSGRLAAVRFGFHWQHPRHGRIAAQEALSIAARAGVLADLELWLLHSGCVLPRLPQGSERPVPVILDISAWQLRDAEFIGHVFELMERHEVPPRLLIFALAAESYSETRDLGKPLLRRLLERGLRFALRGSASEVFGALNQTGPVPLDLMILDAPEIALLPSDSAVTERVRLALLTAVGTELAAMADGVVGEPAREWLAAQGCRYVSSPVLGANMTPEEWAVWSPPRGFRPL